MQTSYGNHTPFRSVGIPTDEMDFLAAAQHRSNWCWAACIEMVCRWNGVHVAQVDIVARTFGTDAYGEAPDWPALSEEISGNLNGWDFDAVTGGEYSIACEHGYGAPSPRLLLDELESGHPVIISYPQGSPTRHAVVVTGAVVRDGFFGPEIAWIVVRDPWPDYENILHQGRREYPAAYLAGSIAEYWIVRTEVRPGLFGFGLTR